MDRQKIFYIAEIIAKSFREKLSEKEQFDLDSWKDSTPEHSELLKEFSRFSFWEEKMIAERLCGKERAYQEFCKRQNEFQHRKRLRLLQYGSVVAVVIIAWVSFLVFESKPVPDKIIAQQILQAGRSQAVLTLADGQKMLLGDEQQDTLLKSGSVVLKATASIIEYDFSDSSSTQTVYNQLDIPRKGEYCLVLADGTKVWLNSESQLKYPVVFYGNERRVYLQGEAYFEVSRNEQMPFIVEIGTSAVQVLGTSFNVRAYADEACIFTTLVEGSVRLSNEINTLLLQPEEQGIIQVASKEIKKRKVDVALYTSWKEGRFIFENQTLEEIMHTLTRWYDVEVFFTNEKVKAALFNGNLKRYDDFNQIVKMLEMTGVAHFKIEGNTIVVSE